MHGCMPPGKFENWSSSNLEAVLTEYYGVVAKVHIATYRHSGTRSIVNIQLYQPAIKPHIKSNLFSLI